MKVLFFNLLVLSLFAVGCDNNPNNKALNTRTDDSNLQQREEDSSGHLNSRNFDREKSEDMTTGAGATGNDLGTNRGAGSAAGSNDAAGMGMDE